MRLNTNCDMYVGALVRDDQAQASQSLCQPAAGATSGAGDAGEGRKGVDDGHGEASLEFQFWTFPRHRDPCKLADVVFPQSAVSHFKKPSRTEGLKSSAYLTRCVHVKVRDSCLQIGMWDHHVTSTFGGVRMMLPRVGDADVTLVNSEAETFATATSQAQAMP